MKFLGLNKNVMRLSILLINQLILRMFEQLLKSQPWHRVLTIVSLWKFVVVRERNSELAKLAYGSNFEQSSISPCNHCLVYRYWFAKRAHKIARVGGAKNFSEEQLQYFYEESSCWICALQWTTNRDYLALNAGLVAMNFSPCFDWPGNRIKHYTWFDKSKANEVLELKIDSVQNFDHSRIHRRSWNQVTACQWMKSSKKR